MLLSSGRFDEVVTDLTSFMNLFDEVEQLLVSSDKSTCSILDKDCSNSIIGMFTLSFNVGLFWR